MGKGGLEMKIPKKIMICGHTYTIEVKKEPSVDGEVVFGACYQKEQKIILSEGMCEERCKEVLLHECLHAIDEELRLGLGEQVVNVLGLMLKDLIVNNKLDFLS